MKATRLPSGNYRALAYLGTDENGKPIQKSFTAPDAKRAVALAASYEDQHRLTHDAGSFDDLMAQFIKARTPTLSPSTANTYRSYRRTLRGSYAAFCKRRIHSITADDLRDLVADMSSQHAPRHRLHKEQRPSSQKTIKNYIGFISAVFRFAGVPIPYVELPERTVPDIYVPTDAQVHTLIDFVRGTEMYVPVLLAAFGPLRRGEVCALEYPRDFDGDVVHVRESIADTGDALHRKQPKTPFSNRHIEMPDFVIEAIREQGYVCRITPRQITARFPHILHQAGLPDFRFHDLRHYCVSTLHAQGVPDAYIMLRGGWSTDNVLKKVYRHTLADHEQMYSKKAIEHFNHVFVMKPVMKTVMKRK